MKKKVFLAALSLLFAAGSACAQNAPAAGVYVGAGISAAKRSVDYLLPAGVSASDSQYAAVLPGRLFAGYTFTPNWALEAGRTDFGRFDLSYANQSVTGALKTRASSLYLAAKYSVALDQKWSAFGKVGVADNTYKVHGTGVSYAVDGTTKRRGAYLGAGLDYAITPNAGVMVEYENVNHMKADGGRAGTLSVSGRYSF
jgi:OOP family OmpA-OmpF porin